MKKNRRMQIVKGIMALFLIVCMVLPVTIAYAESLGVSGTVLTDTTYVIGDTYQRHTFNAEGLHWVFYANADAIYYTSSADAITWATPTKFDDYLCNMSPIYCCNGSSFSLWYDEVANYVDIAWMNVTGPYENIYYRMGHPVANGSIGWYPSYVAVPKSVGLTYSHPSICDNTDDYPFIAYMVYNGSAYSANISTDISNTGSWASATNSTISSSQSLNISLDVMYPSVVPVSNENISVMVVFDTGVDFLLAQNYLHYNVSSDLWSYPAFATFPLPPTSSIDIGDLAYHSEIGWAGNLSNIDDVYVIATANDSLLGKYLFYDRYGITPFTYDVALATGDYVGSIGIRNALGNLVVTAVEQTQKTQLYNDDYTQATQSWAGMVAIDGIDATSGIQTESDYDNAGTSYLGTIYYDNMAAYSPDLEYGCYGCTQPTPNVISTFGNLAGLVASLVISFLIIALLLGIAVREGMNNGWNEGTKVAIAGIIGIIIIETIVIAFF